MELSKNYNPASVEDRWYKHWMDKGYFRSTPDTRKAYTVVIPPPNVTGVLHMGHTLNETVQDILVRRARMSGYNACWVPGSDHASIATESKVVQMLEKEKGIRKADLTREEFLKYAFEWKEKYGNIIYSQIEKLGCSVDWSRVSFTMDDHYYKAVLKVFVELFQRGLIYRGARMINWDPKARTALSDEEVEYKDLQGTLYYVKYQVSGSDEFISVATQRPETIMGDSALCVHPSDERYAHLKGKKVIVPLVNRAVDIIFDQYVDPAFGTGALKVTPAHDINDYNLGLKHGLEIIDTLNEDGTLSDKAQVFVGLDRFEARRKVVDALRGKGLLLKEEEYTTRLGFSQRNPDTVIEPRISTQWFVRMKELGEPALQAVVGGDIKIHPGEKFLATYRYWLENVKDWCISRQLWWGQQIPAWYDKEGNVYVAETYQDALAQWSAKQPAPELADESQALTQDQDVLDTWFSSWLWPMEVFRGITEPANADINYYYPTSVLVTGQDIIFFWVARMIMAGYAFRGEKPFSDVYFTGMVRDKQGRKMSKSLGNSPDLLELIDKYGADAVRFGIMISSPAGNDLLFDESSLEQGRNFNNKLWNALKLIRMWEERVQPIAEGDQDHFAMQWFENRINQVSREVEEQLKNFKLSEALKTIYSLIWDDFCSWYLEWIKPGFEQPVDGMVYKKTLEFFDRLLQLLHPFMPFITEELYHLSRDRQDDLCVSQFNSQFPSPEDQPLQRGELLKEVITAIRDARNKHQLKPKETIDLFVQTSNPSQYREIEKILCKQVNASQLSYISQAVDHSIGLLCGNDQIYIRSEAPVNVESQRQALQKELAYLKGFLVPVNNKLNNERFVQNAKPDVLALEQKKKADAEAKIQVIEESLAQLS